jgi:hypothetical protein
VSEEVKKIIFRFFDTDQEEDVRLMLQQRVSVPEPEGLAFLDETLRRVGKVKQALGADMFSFGAWRSRMLFYINFYAPTKDHSRLIDIIKSQDWFWPKKLTLDTD